MQLLNVSLYGKEVFWNVTIGGDNIIFSVNSSRKDSRESLQVDAGGALLLPGLINSHEHLDFNCYPRLGNRKYANYREWGEEIHHTCKQEIENVKKIPSALRVKWGVYKNLLNGFTTALNHGERLFIEDEFISVILKYPALHSVAFEKNWKRSLLNPLTREMIVMHVGEGMDEVSIREIDELIRANVFRKKIVAVHGVAMNIDQARHFAGLVWCPSSNYFLFGKTADLPSLAGKISLLFGTDSTLTSTWNAWEQFREALSSGLASEEQLVDMLTGNAAKFWKLDEGRADLLLIRAGKKVFDSGVEDIMLVMHAGRIRLIDESLFGKAGLNESSYRPVHFGSHRKWVWGDLPGLVNEISSYYPGLEVPFEC